ncbi:MAG: hypothetical protein CMJ81_23700 [Planctomycetaceae bacterium]|nr:hypothetical protein [Planctomycetaceae bacterium]
MITLCLVFLLTSLHRLNHTDLWGHLCYGRLIMSQGLPSSDPFSAETALPAADFVNVPWLAQIAGFLTWKWLGYEGLVLGHASLAVLSSGLLMWAIRLRGVELRFAILGTVLSYMVALPQVGTIRPQLFGTVAFPLVLAAISLVPHRRHPCLWLPLLFVVWANLHGSFALGLTALGICALGDSWDAWRENGWAAVLVDERTRHRWLLAVACGVAACVNPLGPFLLWKVAYFGFSPALENITEWQPLVIKSLGGALFFLSVLLTAWILRRSQRRLNTYEVLLLFLFALLTLLSMRMLAWWALIWPWVVMCRVPHRLTSTPVPDQSYPMASRNTMRTLFALVCVFVTLLWSPPSQAVISGQQRGIGAITVDNTPLYVADRIAQQGDKGNLICPLDWADYILWKSDTSLRPLVYSHVHLVSQQVWDDYLQILSGDPNWLSLVDHYQLNYLLLSRERNQMLRRSVERHPRAEIIYQDQRSLLVRMTAAAPVATARNK